MRRSDICLHLGPADRAEIEAPVTNRNTPRKLVWQAIETIADPGQVAISGALIGRFRACMQPLCSPSSKNLNAYGRWHATRDNIDRSYLDVLRILLALGNPTNTVFLHHREF
jgi:hypothetical protein